MRLHKFLAQAGVASRRHAEQMIRDGRVRVNGSTVTTLGVSVDPAADRIEVDGQPVAKAEVRTTIILNKPVEAVTTMEDPQGRRTVASLVSEEPYRLVPIGRLDYHTEGVLLMTTDGELAHRLLHPRWKVPKIYLVKVAGHPTEAALDRLRRGVQLEDGPTQPAVVELLDSNDRASWIELVLTEGRQRQVRRMCEAVGHRALRVVRTSFATIGAEDLRPGQYRYLSRAELAVLYKLVELEEEVPQLSERAREQATKALGVGERGKGALPGEDEGVRMRTRRGGRAEADKSRAERHARGEDRAERYGLRPRRPRAEAQEGRDGGRRASYQGRRLAREGREAPEGAIEKPRSFGPRAPGRRRDVEASDRPGAGGFGRPRRARASFGADRPERTYSDDRSERRRESLDDRPRRVGPRSRPERGEGEERRGGGFVDRPRRVSPRGRSGAGSGFLRREGGFERREGGSEGRPRRLRSGARPDFWAGDERRGGGFEGKPRRVRPGGRPEFGDRDERRGGGFEERPRRGRPRARPELSDRDERRGGGLGARPRRVGPRRSLEGRGAGPRGRSTGRSGGRPRGRGGRPRGR